MNTHLKKENLKELETLASIAMSEKLYEKYSDESWYATTLSMGPIAFQVLRCAVRIGLFDELDRQEAQTAEELASTLSLDPYALNICLRALKFLKLIIDIDMKYYNHPLNTLSFLKKHGDIFYSDSRIEYMHHIVGPACSFLEESVRSNQPHGLYNLYGKGRNFYEAISEDKERIQYFDAFMKNITNRSKESVTSDPFFAKHRKILDVGGSTGDIAISLANNNPELKATVMDFPEILKIASEKFKEHKLEDRLDTYAGDALQPYPPGYDCILFFHFFDIFSPEDISVLLQNAYSALPPKGSVCVFTPVSYENAVSANDLFSPYFLCLAEGEGKFYTKEQIIEWMNKNDFGNVSVKELPFDDAFITAQKG